LGRSSVQVVIGLFAIVLLIFSLLLEFLPWEPVDMLISDGAAAPGTEGVFSTPVKG
jgi:peptidoglycan biosynthesis protein MviN/MurJ (putative lipid II flippase)